MRTDAKIREWANKVVAEKAKATSKAMLDCEYYAGIPVRGGYCKTTSQTSCLRCKFYSPTHRTRLRVIAEDNMDLTEKKNLLTDQLYGLKKYIADLENQLTMAKTMFEVFRMKHITLADVLEKCDSAEVLK